MKRFKYIDDSALTATGENVLLSLVEIPVEAPPKVKNDDFNEIWLTFPVDDSFRGYPKTRQIRYNKPETKRAYEAALNFKTHEELLTALRNEVAYRKQSESENLLKYMYISYNWFNKQGYDNGLMPEKVEAAYGKGIV